MTRHAPSGRTASYRRAVAALLSLLAWLLVIGSAVAAADEYPIVIGSDENTLLAPPATASDAGYDPRSPAQLSEATLTYRLFDAVLNEDDRDAATTLVADDAVIQTDFGTYAGPEGLLSYAAFVKRTYPDAVFDVTNVTMRGNSLDVSWILTATRVVLDPVEQPFAAHVLITGSTSISFDQSQVTELRMTNDTVLIDTSGSETVGAP